MLLPAKLTVIVVSPTPMILIAPLATVATCVLDEPVAMTVSPSGLVLATGAVNVSPNVAE